MATATRAASSEPNHRPIEHWIIGNPTNRRVCDYQAAANAVGLPVPPCLSWHTVLASTDDALQPIGGSALLRIDSPREDANVLRQLIHQGGSQVVPRHGQITQLDGQYRGLVRVLDRIAAWANGRPGITFQNTPADIAVMFDKWLSHQRFQAAGLDRPPTCRLPLQATEFREMRHQLASPRSGRLFLKPRYASSASGVCAYRWSAGGEHIIAPIELVREGNRVILYNSLRMRSYTRLGDIDAILGELLPQQMIAERWVQKSRLDGQQFDLRFVVIDGQTAHWVVRQSRWPMTNLHLGNLRGDWQAVRREIGESRAQQCLEVALQAASCFPDSLYAGVDIIVPLRGKPFVCEINAFGDLLPGVSADGRFVYQSILRAAQMRSCHV